jgi:hypothetical protein
MKGTNIGLMERMKKQKKGIEVEERNRSRRKEGEAEERNRSRRMRSRRGREGGERH